MKFKNVFSKASLMFMAAPILIASISVNAHENIQANELTTLQQNSEQARNFDYCTWAFDKGGKNISLPNYDAMLERETTSLSPEEWAATALLDAGTRIAQNATTKEACNNSFAVGTQNFDTQLEASLASHWAQAKYKKKKNKQIALVQKTLVTFWVEDQAARRVYIASKTEDKTGAEHWTRRLAVTHTAQSDDRSTQYMKDLLNDYDWIDRKRFGKRVSMAAWLIVQHADGDVELQSLALSRMEPYLKNGGIDKSNYAFLWDRVAVNSGQKQRYGTQPTWECTAEGNLTLQPLEDPENVNKRRKKMGMGSVEKSLANMAKSVCG